MQGHPGRVRGRSRPRRPVPRISSGSVDSKRAPSNRSAFAAAPAPRVRGLPTLRGGRIAAQWACSARRRSTRSWTVRASPEERRDLVAVEEQDVVGRGDRHRPPPSRPADAHRRTGGATTGPPVDPVVVDLGQRPDPARVAEQLLEAREPLWIVRQREPRTPRGQDLGLCRQVLAPRLGVDRHRVLDPLGELGQEQVGSSTQDGRARSSYIWPRWPCSARKASQGVHEAPPRPGAPRAPSRVTRRAGGRGRSTAIVAAASAASASSPPLDVVELVDAPADQPERLARRGVGRRPTRRGRPGRRGPGTARGSRRNGSPSRGRSAVQTSSQAAASSSTGIVSTGTRRDPAVDLAQLGDGPLAPVRVGRAGSPRAGRRVAIVAAAARSDFGDRRSRRRSRCSRSRPGPGPRTGRTGARSRRRSPTPHQDVVVSRERRRPPSACACRPTPTISSASCGVSQAMGKSGEVAAADGRSAVSVTGAPRGSRTTVPAGGSAGSRFSVAAV